MKKYFFFIIAIFALAMTVSAPRVFADNGFPDPDTFSTVSAVHPVEFSCTPGTSGGYQLIPKAAGLVALSSGDWDTGSGASGADQTVVNSALLCSSQVMTLGQWNYIDGLGDNEDYLIVDLGSAIGGGFYDVLWVKEIHYTDSSTGFTFVPTNTNTRIISVTPQDNTTQATSTSFVFDVEGYINENDFDDVYDVTLEWKAKHSQVAGCEAGINSTFAICAFPTSTGTYEVRLTDLGTFTVSTTTSLLNIGQYYYTVKVTKPRFSFLGLELFTDLIVSTSTDFTLATSSKADIVSQESTNALIEFSEGIVGNTVDACVIDFSGSFDFQDCMISFFLPDREYIIDTIDNLREDFLVKLPMGYLTRFVEITISTPTSTLPTISYTSSNTSIFNGASFTFDPFETLSSTTGIVSSAVSDSNDPQNVWDIMEYPIYIVVYLTLLFMIVHDVTGVSKHRKI